MLTTVAVSGYRSLRELVVPLHGLDVVTGANGSGKSSLYRALRLLADCGGGRVIGSLAREGGLQSALWAGPATLGGSRREGYAVQGTVRKGPISLRLGFAASSGFGYLVDLGLPQPIPSDPSAFDRDPVIKREVVFSGAVARPGSVLVARSGPSARSRDGRGWVELTRSLQTHESMLTELADPDRAPELLAVREQLRGWRFYDGFRTDAGAPARQPQVGTRTPVLGHDGADLAAALQTIREVGDHRALDTAVADAFDGARVDVTVAAGRFDIALSQPGMLRPLAAAELSDGTLRYLLLVAALLTPRPPRLMVLNEPETSLHPDLLAPLARLIKQAAESTQVVVVSHAAALISALAPRDAGEDDEHEAHDLDAGRAEAYGVRLAKDLGETRVEGQGLLTTPAWHWGSR
ncbi:MAG: AAA family ATPase [Actinomycetota bacterium]|nr:AAA family ATPase [Actinomycetota bacterium]